MYFEIKAINHDGEVAVLVLEAGSDGEAVSQAQDQGYAVLAVRQRSFSWTWSRSGFQLALFTQELLALLSSGVGIVEAVETLARARRPQGDGLARRLDAAAARALVALGAPATALVGAASPDALRAALADHYAGEPLVSVAPMGSAPRD